MLKTLDNGVRLIAQPLPSYNSFAVGIWVKTGSTCEQPKENGISHFIEHMLFKGTEKRTAKQIAVDMDKIGGQLAAALPSRVGGRVPAYATAGGKALLAGLEPEQVDALYPGPQLPARTERM